MSARQFQSALQIWPLVKKVEFLGTQKLPFEGPWRHLDIRGVILETRYDVIWNLTPILIWPLLRGGVGLHIIS